MANEGLAFWPKVRFESKRRLAEVPFYDLHEFVLPIAFSRHLDVKVRGKGNLPNEGGIIALNHTTGADYYVAGMALAPRQIHYFVQVENIRDKLLKNTYHFLIGNIWVMVDGERSNDPGYKDRATRTNLDAKTRAGDYLRLTNDDIGVFVDGPSKDSIDPQGNITPLEGRVFHEGAAIIARRNKKLVIPVAVRTTDEISRLFWEVGDRGFSGSFHDLKEYVEKHGKVQYGINIGKPLDFRGVDTKEGTAELKRVICGLYDGINPN